LICVKLKAFPTSSTHTLAHTQIQIQTHTVLAISFSVAVEVAYLAAFEDSKKISLALKSCKGNKVKEDSQIQVS